MNIRRPTGADAKAVAGLVRAFETHFTGIAEMTEPDLRHEWWELDLDRDAWLVEVDADLAGYRPCTRDTTRSWTATCTRLTSAAGSAHDLQS
jgi:hypothetical protein